MPEELPKAYDPTLIEERWAQYWVNEHLFDALAPTESDAPKAFTVLLRRPT